MTVSGKYAVDFVGRTDHLVEDLAAIRAEINARRCVRSWGRCRCCCCRCWIHGRAGRRCCSCPGSALGAELGPAAPCRCRPKGVRPLPVYKEPESRNTYGADCQEGGGGPAAGRRLASGYRHEVGMYWADLNYCDKADFYRGRHAACLQSISGWYKGDVDLVHGAGG